jgi:hypothetical protein
MFGGDMSRRSAFCFQGIIASALAAGVGLLAVPSVARAAYTIVKIADNNGPYDVFSGGKMNDAGQVVFSASLDAGGSGIFTGSDPAADAVATTAGPYASFLTGINNGVAINNTGTIVFAATLDAGGQGIFKGPDVTTDTIIDTNGGPYERVGSPSINDAGAIAFLGAVDGSAGEGVFKGPNPTTDALARATPAGPYQGVPLGEPPSINEAGTVVFHGVANNNSGVYKGPNPAADAIVTSAGPYGQIQRAPVINDSGVVAFAASAVLPDRVFTGIFIGPNPETDAIVTSQGPYGTQLGNSFDFNDLGQVAFLSDLDTGNGPGIYAGPDPVLHKVVVPGDAHFGGTIGFMFLLDINNQGDILFQYGRTGSTERGIAVARVPEPASVTVLALAAWCVCGRRRKGPRGG